MEKLTGVAFNGGGGSALTIKDHGTTLTTGATSIDFTGAGVTATASGTNITVDIPGGGGGGGVESVTGLNTDNTDPLNPIVQISINGSSLWGDGTPGAPLRTSIPTYDNIQLTSDYTAPSEGIYEVTVGTNFDNFHAFTPPDPSGADNTGKRIVVTNKDQSFSVFFNGTVYIRGTAQPASIIPPLATYEYVSMYLSSTPSGPGWYWVLTSPDYVVFPDIDLSLGDYTIYTYGTYTVSSAADPGKIVFPNPALFNGQEITIINKDNVYKIDIAQDGNNPVYQGFGSIPFPAIDAGMIVKFISDGVLWRSEPNTQEPVYNGIDLSVSQLTITTPGCYSIINPGDGTYSVTFPNPSGYDGQTITLWNKSDIGWAYFDDNGYLPRSSRPNIVIEYIDVFTVMTFKCMEGFWVLVNQQA